MKRRDFIKLSSGLAISLCAPLQLMGASGNGINRPKVIYLQLAGGNDGLNTVVPTSPSQYALYESYRPTLKLPLNELIPLGTNSDGVPFGLNPACASLQPYLNHLALFPSTHCGEGASRSHFELFKLYAQGGYADINVYDRKGWLGRYMEHFPSQDSIYAFSGDYRNFAGDRSVFMHSKPSKLALYNSLDERLKSVEVNPYGYEASYDLGQKHMIYKIDQLKQAFEGYTLPEIYQNDHYGKTFSQAKVLLEKMDEIDTIYMKFGGYDTHKAQFNKQQNNLTRLSNALAAFMEDIGQNENVMVIVMSEMGRTVHENASKGTDHGAASCWMALGNRVQGGIYGTWSGLEEEKLDRGRFVKQTTDYRDVLHEVLSKHRGDPLAASCFPGYTPSNELGFIKTS